MQRALAYALSPAPAVPLRFLLTAPWFALLAAVLVLWTGEQAFASRWASATLGATHLLTLGYLSMAMAGSMLQLIAVVAGAPVTPSRLAAAACWGALALGALLLSGALWANLVYLFLPSALLLCSAFALLLATIAGPLARRPVPGAQPMVRGMRFAVGGLLATLALGLALAMHFGGHAALPILELVDLHAAWGLLGWVAMLVVGVSFQVIPMFQSSATYPSLVTRAAPWLLCASVLAWSAVRWFAPESAVPAAIPAAAVLAGFAALSAWLLARTKRKQADATTLYWRLSLASLCASALLYFAPGSDTGALITGIVFMAGFAMGVVNGMLYKIVPFLLWYHMQQDPRAARGQVPPVRTILPDERGRRQFWWHAAALAALAGAVYWPAILARPAAALLAVASLRLALDLNGAAWRCRRLQQLFQPS